MSMPSYKSWSALLVAAALPLPRAYAEVPGSTTPASPAAPPTPSVAPSAPSSTPSKVQKARLDLSTPDVPAFTALGVSPTKISTPTNVKEFAAALATGINAAGQLQSGVAIEVAPAQLIDNAISDEASDSSDLWQHYLGGLALSIATNSVAAGATSNMQMAFGARYAYSAYTPASDRELARCINTFIPAPAIASIIDAAGNPVGVQPSTDNVEFQSSRGACRNTFKAAHLASSGLQVAYVHSVQAVGSSKISDFETFADSAWLSLSLGINTFHAPTGADWKAPPVAPSNALGIQPTLMVRYDVTRIPTLSKSQGDLFIGGRLPFISTAFSVFLEAGYKKGNLGDVASPPAVSSTEVPLGLGVDLRLADGKWFGLYAGGDAKSGSLFSVANIKWSLGEDRPYSY